MRDKREIDLLKASNEEAFAVTISEILVLCQDLAQNKMRSSAS